MRNKSEVELIFKSWKQRVEHESGCKLQRFRTDSGREYILQTLFMMLHDCGIKHEKTPAHTPEMNGVAERFNRSLVEMMKSMLYEAELNNTWWGEAAMAATYLLNVLPTAALNKTTPFEEWKGNKPDLGHLQIFGSECWVQVPKATRKKLDNHAEKGTFVGYAETRNIYRVAVNGKVSVYRDVRFRENVVEMAAASAATYKKTTPISDADQQHQQQDITKAGGDQRSGHQEENPNVLSKTSEDEQDETLAISTKQKKAAKGRNW